MIKIFKILSGLLVLLFLTSNSYGQITVKLADQAYNDFSWNEAIELYLYAYERNPKYAYVIRKLADCYRNIGKTEEVEVWLKKLIEMNEQTPEDLSITLRH